MTVREFVGPTTPDGPLSGQTLNYGLDMRDLFIHGDQWINNADAMPGPSGGYAPALPTAAGEMRFVNDAMVDALFVAGASSYIRQDGLVQMTILSNPTTASDNT